MVWSELKIMAVTELQVNYSCAGIDLPECVVAPVQFCYQLRNWWKRTPSIFSIDSAALTSRIRYVPSVSHGLGLRLSDLAPLAQIDCLIKGSYKEPFSLAQSSIVPVAHWLASTGHGVLGRS